MSDQLNQAAWDQRYGKNDAIDLSEVNKWRGTIYDKVQGLITMDLAADNEADAKGLVAEIAARHKQCVNLVYGSCVVIRWTALPDALKQGSNFKRS